MKNTTKLAFLRMIIKTGDWKKIVKVAEFMKWSPIEEICNEIAKTNNPEIIYEFTSCIPKDISGVPINKMANTICEIGCFDYIYLFARDVKDAPIDKLQIFLCKQREKNDLLAKYIYLFASNIKGANIYMLTEAICNVGNPEYIYYFASDIKGAPIELLIDAICASNDIFWIEKFMAIYFNMKILN